MKIYCEGSNCSKRDKCGLHNTMLNEVYEFIDWSTTGSGHAWRDEKGSHCSVDYNCGNLGNFRKFKPIEVLPKQKSSIEIVLNPQKNAPVYVLVDGEQYNIEHLDWRGIDSITICNNTFVRK